MLTLQGEDPSGKRTQFWDEFFLLKVIYNFKRCSHVYVHVTVM